MTLFDPHTFGPQPGDRVIRCDRGEPASYAKSFAGFGASFGSTQIVIVLAAVALAAVVFVVGLLVGAGIEP
jgi:hypothetical protein